MKALTIPIAAFVLATFASGQVSAFRDGFENGISNWTLSGLWRLEGPGGCGGSGSSFPSPSHDLWFGNPATCTYDGYPYNGDAVSVPFQLGTSGQTARLSLWSSLATAEDCAKGSYDCASVSLSVDGGTWIALDYHVPPTGSWLLRQYDLSAHTGHSVRVRLYFTAGDNWANDAPGWRVDDVRVELDAGIPYCTATYFSCPCSGQGGPPFDGGCRNSTGAMAQLAGSGLASIGSDTFALTAMRMPATTSLVFAQGTPLGSAVIFGDGMRCIGAPIMRLAVATAVSGTASYPGPGDVPISVAGSTWAGLTRGYQVYYRDAATFCTSATFNLTNGYRQTWIP